MARFHLSNNKQKHNLQRRYNAEADLKESFNSESEIYTTAYDKRSFTFGNNYQNGTDWVVVVGTLIYKEGIGHDSWKQLLNDFEETKDIKVIRENSIGNYSICIHKKGVTYVFTDKYHVKDIYYSDEKSGFSISSEIYTLAKVIDNIDVSIEKLYESAFNIEAKVGGGTFFKSIRRLRGWECLVAKNNTLVVEKIQWKRERYYQYKSSLKQCTDDISREITNTSKVIAKIFHSEDIVVQQTAGLDSRLVLASLLNVGLKPNLGYGQGNSSLTNTKDDDLKIGKQLASKFNLKHTVYDWSDDNKENLDCLEKKYGVFYQLYAGNSNVFKMYEVGLKDKKIIFTGLFGEILRIREFIDENNINKISIRSLVENFLSIDKISKKDMLSTLIKGENYLEENIQNFIEELSIMMATNYKDEDYISSSDIDYIRFISDSHSNGFLNNLISEFQYNVTFLSEEKIFEKASDVNIEYREKAILNLNLINNLKEDVLSIPLMSHCKPTKWNLENGLEFIETPYVKIREKIKKSFPKLYHTVLKDFFLKILISDKRYKHKDLIKLIRVEGNKYLKHIKDNNIIKESLIVRYLLQIRLIKNIEMHHKKNISNS